jgi:hypothetical protein
VRFAALIGLTLALAATANAGTAHPRQTGVLQGAVTRSPTCAKEQPCTSVPGVKLVFYRHGHPVAQTTSTEAGAYRIRLRAGRYGIRIPGRASVQPSRVRVLRGQVTRVNIEIGPLRDP